MFYIIQSDCQFVELDLIFYLNFFYYSTRLFVGEYGMSVISVIRLWGVVFLEFSWVICSSVAQKNF